MACTLQDWARFLNLHANSDISGFDYLTPAPATRLIQATSLTSTYADAAAGMKNPK